MGGISPDRCVTRVTNGFTSTSSIRSSNNSEKGTQPATSRSRKQTHPFGTLQAFSFLSAYSHRLQSQSRALYPNLLTIIPLLRGRKPGTLCISISKSAYGVPLINRVVIVLIPFSLDLLLSAYFTEATSHRAPALTTFQSHPPVYGTSSMKTLDGITRYGSGRQNTFHRNFLRCIHKCSFRLYS